MKQLLDSPIKVIGGIVLLVESILTLILTTGNPTDEQKLWITIGMVATVPLALISAVLIHWIDNRKKLSGVIVPPENNKYEYDIFISFPIAAMPDPIKRKEINDFANNLEKELNKLGYKKNFNASLHFTGKHDHQAPKVAAKIDFDALNKSRNFLLIYPEKLPTSALIELGYALAGNKNIIMCSDNIHTLPFLARGFNETFKNVSFIEYSDTSHLLNILTQTHDTYFTK
jgi:hypothetical protein